MPVSTLCSGMITTADLAVNQEYTFADGDITGFEDVTFDHVDTNQISAGDTATVNGVTYNVVSESGGYGYFLFDDGSGPTDTNGGNPTDLTYSANVTQFELNDPVSGDTIHVSFAMYRTDNGTEVGPVPNGATLLGFGVGDDIVLDSTTYHANVETVSGDNVYSLGGGKYESPLPPCFTTGAMVETDQGLIPVEDLALGDRVRTRDNGFQPVRWICARKLSPHWFRSRPELRPVVIKQGAFGENQPSQDMMVSPGHMILAVDAGGAETLIPASKLLNLENVYQSEPIETSYFHLFFDTHQVIMVDGIWSESFLPGLQSLVNLGGHARAELFEIFPELKFRDTLMAVQPARPLAYRGEARRIAKNFRAPAAH